MTDTTWGKYGRTFSTDTFIHLASSTALQVGAGGGALTTIVWIYPTALPSLNEGILGYTAFDNWCNYHFGASFYFRNIDVDGGTQTQSDGTSLLVLNTWQCRATTYVDSTKVVNFFKDGVFSETDTNAKAMRTTSWGTFAIGKMDAREPAAIIGECLLYNRDLSEGELRRNCQATKWRYTS